MFALSAHGIADFRRRTPTNRTESSGTDSSLIAAAKAGPRLRAWRQLTWVRNLRGEGPWDSTSGFAMYSSMYVAAKLREGRICRIFLQRRSIPCTSSALNGVRGSQCCGPPGFGNKLLAPARRKQKGLCDKAASLMYSLTKHITSPGADVIPGSVRSP